jgi:hypothetical protein
MDRVCLPELFFSKIGLHVGYDRSLKVFGSFSGSSWVGHASSIIA